MPGSISHLWTQIVHWLRENAPRTVERLNPPADERALAGLASEWGIELPPDLVELLRHCNGSDPAQGVTGIILLPPGYHLMDSSWIGRDTRQRAAIWGDDWHPTWLAIGSDLCGGCLVLDTQPQPPYGRVFEFDKVEGPFGSAWDSLADLLSEMLALLEGQNLRLAHRIPHDYPRPPDPLRPIVRDGELEWERGRGDWTAGSHPRARPPAGSCAG
ncbi:SMI1/KNR4 family protein [Micromonospora sp. PLK6-60]|uniref:SMI1/KNR4 family protein n=1 Tax=Micromonospora sp. PLK6-60 TaxID=2873383 RepID=UPI001CA71B6A|nr:SMI1/KNR4 family protein [Micromonospora sp. PLK6-60]MBY8873549.1 SMI1/KNR4 family protein [Micromonospora sp. PLK6-60]